MKRWVVPLAILVAFLVCSDCAGGIDVCGTLNILGMPIKNGVDCDDMDASTTEDSAFEGGFEDGFSPEEGSGNDTFEEGEASEDGGFEAGADASDSEVPGDAGADATLDAGQDTDHPDSASDAGSPGSDS
jgi:hypothetical protein